MLNMLIYLHISKIMIIFAVSKNLKTNNIMLYVGQFNESQLIAKEDKKAIEKVQQENDSLKYVDTKLVKKKGKIVAIKIWLLTVEEYSKLKHF